MGVTKKAIYRKSASQICCKESNFIFASSCFGKGTELVWKAKSSTGDYHDEMNGDKILQVGQGETDSAFATKVCLLHRNSTVARRVTNVTSEHYGNP